MKIGYLMRFEYLLLLTMAQLALILIVNYHDDKYYLCIIYYWVTKQSVSTWKIILYNHS